MHIYGVFQFTKRKITITSFQFQIYFAVSGGPW
jgi:hypothetical protein